MKAIPGETAERGKSTSTPEPRKRGDAPFLSAFAKVDARALYGAVAGSAAMGASISAAVCLDGTAVARRQSSGT
jgi:hypothetical protein